MRYGGNAIGSREVARKSQMQEDGMEIEVGTRDSGDKRYDDWDNRTIDHGKDEKIGTGDHKGNQEPKVQEQAVVYLSDGDADMKDTATEQTSMYNRVNTYETMAIDSSAETIVQCWEAEVAKWEKELAGAATEDFKKMVNNKLQNAQLMLKEALLRLTIQDEQQLNRESDNQGEDMKNNTSAKEGEGTLELVDHDSDDMSGTSKGTEEGNYGGKDDKNKGSNVGSKDQHTKTTKVSGHTKDLQVGGNEFQFNWGDISDDDTVVLQNQEPTQWKLVTPKKISTKNNSANTNKEKKPYSDLHHSNAELNKTYSETQKSKDTKSSLTSYLEITKGKFRSENKNSIRVTMSFTPRTAGSGEITRIVREVLSFGKEIDEHILLLPWSPQTDHGPINCDDISNPRNLGENIRKYMYKPQYINFQPGSPVYGIGLQFSTDLEKHIFMSKWNLKKQEYKQNNRAAYSIALAPMQNSPGAFIIGIAVGSTEKQDYEILNKKLAAETGIEGIEVSFQNITQAGVTQEFWKLANDRAMSVNSDKYSRDHLREKYRWAPNALAVYVPRKELVTPARKIMLSMYGKARDGNDPIWPDGSTMRFLPIKGPTIKNEKTRSIVRKRLAFHIWLKVNEVTIDTNLVNIHQSIDAFEGLTFSEIVLQSTTEDDKRVFTHFNRVWSNDPSKEKWALSVKTQMYDSAIQTYNNLRDNLFDKYGPDINCFFNDSKVRTGWKDAVITGNTLAIDEDDDWFDDDDNIEDIVKKGLVDSTFLQFFGNKNDDEDKQSVASWGTGNTAYTEIITPRENSSTVDSSITPDTSTISHDEKEKKKEIVPVRLMLKGVEEPEITKMINNQNPYQLALWSSSTIMGC